MSRMMARTSTYLTGEPEHVANVLQTAAAQGRLVEYGEPRTLADGRVQVWVVMDMPQVAGRDRETIPTVPAPRRRPPPAAARPPRDVRRILRRVLKAVCAVLVLGAVAAAFYALYLLIQWVMAHILLILGGLVGLVVVVGLMLGKSGGGSHCPGCGHR